MKARDAPLGLQFDPHEEERTRNRETKNVVDEMETWPQEQLDAYIRRFMLEIEQNLDDLPDSMAGRRAVNSPQRQAEDTPVHGTSPVGSRQACSNNDTR